MIRNSETRVGDQLRRDSRDPRHQNCVTCQDFKLSLFLSKTNICRFTVSFKRHSVKLIEMLQISDGRSVGLFVDMFVGRSVGLSIGRSVDRSVRPSVRPSVRRSAPINQCFVGPLH